MTGDSRQHFCESCNRSVYDLSALTRKQAYHLLKSSPAGLCGRITRDDTGEMVFQPEPQPVLTRFLRISLLGISACAARASTSPVSSCSVELRVADPVNAGIAGAHVTISTAENIGSPHESETDSAGLVNQRLDPGRYRLQIQAPGFYPYTRDVDVACEDKSPTRIDAQLQLGVMMGEVVEVRPLPANPFARAWYRATALLWRFRHSF